MKFSLYSISYMGYKMVLYIFNDFFFSIYKQIIKEVRSS